MLSAAELEILTSLHARRAAAGRGGKDQLFKATARALGCSVPTVYRKLQQADLADERKRRSDAGESLLSDDELSLVAGMMMVSRNQKGQGLPADDTLDMAFAGGLIQTRVSASTLHRQLYQRRMHPEQLALPSASIRMAAAHYNHVWQIDSTVGAYYYLPGGRMRFMPEDEFYKNKPANLVKASTDLITRYSCVDVASHCGKGRHYLGGETAENLLDFVTWAMFKQDDSPMHGVPFMVVMDPGAANKGHLMRNFCKNVGVRLEHHKAGAARVTGSVEKFHDLVGMHFEKRLRFFNPAEVSLDWLNLKLNEWMATYCSTRVHTRHGKTRYAAWMAIKQEHLRAPASLEVLRDAAVRQPETRRVANDRSVSFNGRTYDVSMVPGVVAGLKVTLQVNVFRDPSIDVLFIDPDTGEETWHVVAPQEFNELGYPVGAPVWGEEFRSASNSDLDNTRNRLVKQAYKTGDGLPTLEEAARARKAHAQAYAGVVDAMADVNATQVPTYLPKRTTPLALPERRVEARRLNRVEALQLIMARIGAAYTPQVREDLIARWPDGVPEDEIDGFCAALTQPADDGRASALRLIGGGAA